MQISAIILAITLLISPIVLSIIYIAPLLPYLQELSNGAFIIFAWILAIILIIILIFFIIRATYIFKQARALNENKLVGERKIIFGYGIFIGILNLPAIFGLAMLVCAIFINDNLKENESLTNNSQKLNTKDIKFINDKQKPSFDDQVEKLTLEISVLNDLKKQGLITEKEYIEKKKQILGIE